MLLIEGIYGLLCIPFFYCYLDRDDRSEREEFLCAEINVVV